MRIFSLALALIGSVACSDYEFTAVPEGSEGTCPTDAPEGYDALPVEGCEREPAIGVFDPDVEWRWQANPVHPEYDGVETPPIVIDINDDGTPDLIFTAFAGSAYRGVGAMIAVSGIDGTTLWSRDNFFGHDVWGISGIAAIRIDGDMALFVAVDGGLARVDGTGNGVWFAPGFSEAGGLAAPAVGDVDADGVPDIALGAQVYDADGTLLWAGSEANGKRHSGSFLVDVDGDGRDELVSGPTLYDDDGTVLWHHEHLEKGWPAIGDLTGDGQPEIVVVRRPTMSVLSLDGTELWTEQFAEAGGGPPTVADFDGDGQAEIGLAAKAFYRVYEGDGTLLWQHAIQEVSSGMTGSSVFDFEGDGAAEVVYADEGTLWVFDGASGAVELAWDLHNSGTRFEYPTIADIDADGGAEIIVPHGRAMHGTESRGFSVIGSESGLWAPAREVWNQHAYFITNVEDDGSLPAISTPNWTSWNNFRAANDMTPQGLELPDLAPAAPDACISECAAGNFSFFVPVENGGAVDAEFVEVLVERMDGTTRTVVRSEQLAIVPAEGSAWAGPFELQQTDFGTHGVSVRVVPTVPFGSDGVYECDTTNNEWRYTNWPCD